MSAHWRWLCLVFFMGAISHCADSRSATEAESADGAADGSETDADETGITPDSLLLATVDVVSDVTPRLGEGDALDGSSSSDGVSDVETDAPAAVDTDALEDVASPIARDAENADVPFSLDSDASDVVLGSDVSWRSALYPVDWSPEFTDEEGRFLHDFSYAGYHNGETPLATEVGDLLLDTVVAFGADPTGATDSTAAIQAAIDEAGAAGGGVVFLPAGDYRIDGVLAISGSHVVLRGEGPDGTRVAFTKSDAMAYTAHIRFAGALQSDLEIPLVSDGQSRSVSVEVDDATGVEIGDDVAIGWVITDAFVEAHGMTGTWEVFNGSWQPFFWRDVVAVDTGVDPHVITVDVPLRYPAKVSDGASLRRYTGVVRECGLESLSVGNAVAWDAAWAQDQVQVVEMKGVADCWMRDVTSFSPPGAPESGIGAGDHVQSGGIRIEQSKRVTVADSVFERAQHRGGGGNGYLFEVRQSSEVLFRDNIGREGRHNFIQNWGFGNTGCVWLRVHSLEGLAQWLQTVVFGGVGYSELHHSLATANLIDDSTFDDGWSMVNRHQESSGAGHTGTENVVWNMRGAGLLRSRQFGWGYVIGTGPSLEVQTSLGLINASGTSPEDWVEGLGTAEMLDPPSLYEDQLTRRLSALD